MTSEATMVTGLVATKPGRRKPTRTERVPLTGVKIDVVARGTAAAVTVTQRYVNYEKVPVEAVYSFPLEEQAAVFGFEALIGDRRIAGEIAPKEEAFETYDEAMAEGFGAYLLDQDRPNLFTASVGNLLPAQQAVITIRYVAPLERNGDQIRLKIPTTVAPRYIPEKQLRQMDPAEFDHLNPPTVMGGVPYGLALTVQFEGASDVLDVECPSHRVKTVIAGTKAIVELAGGDVQLDQDVVVCFTMAHAGDTELHAVRDELGDLILMLDLLPRITDEREPVEAVFLIDRSGSMSGSSIQQARNALLLALASLREGDSFNVYGFGSTYESVFGHSVPYEDGSLNEARQAVARWDADLGGTELMSPLQHILEQRHGKWPRKVLLLTDGEVGNEQQCVDLVRSHSEETSVFTIGVGYGASDFLVNGLARAGDGWAEFVHPNERVESAVMRQMSRVTAAGLRDVRIDWGGLPVDLTAPATLPPLYPGSPLRVYARVPAKRLDLQHSAIELAVEASGPEGVLRFPVSTDLELARPDAAIPRLFAREAIRDLEEGRAARTVRGSQQRVRKDRQIKQMIVELATRYTLMSSETSFVAIEEREVTEDQEPAELRRIPVAMLKDWHGTASMAYGLEMNMVDHCRGASFSLDAEAESAELASPRMAVLESLAMPCMAASDNRAATRETLYELAGAQRADGSWRWEDGVLEYLDRERMDVEPLFVKLGLDAATAELVGPTLLALGILARDFADLEEDWRPMADKALAWLARHGVKAPKGGISLERWVARRL